LGFLITNMTEKEKKLVLKFLDVHFSNLEKTELKDNVNHQILHKKNSKLTLFLFEKKEESIFVNSKLIIEPILKIFGTDYSETYDLVKEWILKKYNLDCIEIIGMN
jgi:hypothetical protein